MTLFAANFIADMRGPDFLVFHGVVVVATLLLLWWHLRRMDRSTERGAMKIPAQLDPYEIAYLRGGEPEVTRLTIVSLIQRGYLQASGTDEDKISRAPKPPATRFLDDTEREVYDWFSSPLAAAEIFQREKSSSKFSAHAKTYEERLLTEQLLTPDSVKGNAVQLGIVAAIFLIGLAGYKLSVAFERGHHNVGGLFVLGFASVAGVIVVCVFGARRVSRRGRDYLEALQSTFAGLKTKTAAATGNVDTALLLLVGVFGISVLEATTYRFFPKMFKRAAANSSGGCGSSCGSSCGTSSSCSSGSSCGGGGCGGCGGGD